MFTGIILGKGKVVEKRSSGSGMIFTLETDFDLGDHWTGGEHSRVFYCRTEPSFSGIEVVGVCPLCLDGYVVAVICVRYR